MLHEASAPLLDGYDLVMLDLDGSSTSAGTPYRTRPAPAPGPRGRRAPGVRHQQRLRTPDRSRTTSSSSAWPPSPRDVVTSAQAAAHVLADRLGAGRRCSCSAARAAGGPQGGGPRAGEPRRTTRSRWSPATAPTCCGATSCGRGAGPRRAALGGQQHRPDHPDRRRRGARARRAGEDAAGLLRRGAGGGRQAAAAAARRDRTAGGVRPRSAMSLRMPATCTRRGRGGYPESRPAQNDAAGPTGWHETLRTCRRGSSLATQRAGDDAPAPAARRNRTCPRRSAACARRRAIRRAEQRRDR